MELNNTIIYGVGETIPELAIQQNGCMAQWISGILNIYVLIFRPSARIVSMADTITHGLALSFCTLNNILFVSVKPGTLPWHDAPYTPHLTNPLDLPPNKIVEEGYGSMVNYLLVDSADGRILALRPLVLNSRTSNYVIQTTHELKQSPFDMYTYQRNVACAQMTYSSKDLAEHMSRAYFKLKPSK